jgi:SAM-dependent methyltransferase
MKNKSDDWDSHWTDYSSSAESNPAQQMRHNLIKNLILKEPGERKKLLDIGSGQGDLVQIVKNNLNIEEIVGFEISEKGVCISKSKVPEANFIKADLYNPLAELKNYHSWADIAVCSEVLEHVDDPELFLSLSKKYIAPRGTIIVTVPGGPMSAFDKHIGHKQHFTRKKIRRILENAGYGNIKVARVGFPFFNIYRLTVILRGQALIGDVQEKDDQISRIALVFMKTFKILFKLNIHNIPLGWQMIATAKVS